MVINMNLNIQILDTLNDEQKFKLNQLLILYAKCINGVS